MPRVSNNISRWSADDVYEWISANTDKFGLNQDDLESIAEDPVTGAQLVGKDDEELSQDWALSIHAARKIVRKAQQIQRKAEKRSSEPIISIMNGQDLKVINLGDIHEAQPLSESNGLKRPGAPIQSAQHSHSIHHHHYPAHGGGANSASNSSRHSRRSSLNQIPEAPQPAPGPYPNRPYPPIQGSFPGSSRHGAGMYHQYQQMQQFQMMQHLQSLQQSTTTLTVTIHNDTFMGRLSHPKWWMDGHFDHIPNKIGSRDAVSIQISGDSDTPLVGLLAFTLRLDPRLIRTRRSKHSHSYRGGGGGGRGDLKERSPPIPPWMVGPGGLPFLPPSVGRLYELQQDYLQKLAVHEESRRLRKMDRDREKQQKEEFKRMKEEQREERREERRERRERRRLEKEKKAQSNDIVDSPTSTVTPSPAAPLGNRGDSENEEQRNSRNGSKSNIVEIDTTAITSTPTTVKISGGLSPDGDPYRDLDQEQRSVILNDTESEDDSSSEEESSESNSTELSDLDDDIEVDDPPKYRLIILWSITPQRDLGGKSGKFDRRDDLVRNSVMTSVASSDLLNSMNRFNVLLLEDDTNDESAFNLDNQYFGEMEQAAQIADVEQCLVEHEHFEIAATFGTKHGLNAYTLTIDIDDALGDWPGPMAQSQSLFPRGLHGFGPSADLDPHSMFASGGIGGGSGVRDLFDHESRRDVHNRVRRSQSQPPAPPLGFTTDVARGILSVEPPAIRPAMGSKMFTLSDIVQESRSPRVSGPKLGRFTSLPTFPGQRRARWLYVVLVHNLKIPKSIEI